MMETSTICSAFCFFFCGSAPAKLFVRKGSDFADVYDNQHGVPRENMEE